MSRCMEEYVTLRHKQRRLGKIKREGDGGVRRGEVKLRGKVESENGGRKKEKRNEGGNREVKRMKMEEREGDKGGIKKSTTKGSSSQKENIEQHRIKK